MDTSQGDHHIQALNFKAKKEYLMEMAKKGRDRDEFCEELYYIEQLGGINYLEQELGVHLKKGISEREVEDRKVYYGSNEKKVMPSKSFLSLIWEALEDFTLRILIVAAAASIIAHMAAAKDDSERSIAWIDGFAIFVAVIIAVLVNSINNYQRDKEFRRLNDLSDDRKLISVVRDGEMKEIHISKIVVGDLIKIFEGMDIPADGFVIEGHELTADESAMTGETDPIKKCIFSDCLIRRAEIIAEGSKNTAGKHEVPSPIILSGTKILTGDGFFVAIVVGESSSIGQIKALIQTDAEATPLQQKLEHIARDIGKFGLASAIFTFIILIIRFLSSRAQNNDWGNNSKYSEFADYFIIAVSVIVVAIPEGLPLAVTLSLAYSVKKMLKDNNMVRRMEACETMGGANMICSDKTGTLTQNKMTLTVFWNSKEFHVDTNLEKDKLSSYMPTSHHDLFIQAFACNTSATLNPIKGSKTDIAMLQFLEKCGIDIDKEKNKYLPHEGYIKFPFTSARKRQTTVIEGIQNNTGTGKRLHIKGASEFVLECCSQWHAFEGDLVQPITPQMRVKIEEAIEHMADQALRTICIAYKEITGDEDWKSQDEFGVYNVEKHDLTLLAIIGIKDILRPEVPLAVEKCKIAGIKVRMVTGDNKLTARAIARECGIIDRNNPNSLVLEGREFQARTGGVICSKCLTKECECARNEIEKERTGKPIRVDTIANKEEFKQIIDNLDVLARSRPEDKYALVTGLMELNNVVAVTGDGTNDAPALKKANVGFAMGIAGTEVSREAAAIILLDDNFNSIVKAVVWGRNIYDSIRKFLQFQLTVNIVAVVITMVGAALLQDDVLQPVQMLWVNLIMDTLASLALATEPPRDELLYRKPHGKDDYIVSKLMTKHIILQSIYQITIMMILVFGADFFIPEFINTDINNRYKYYSDAGNGWYYMRSGRKTTIPGNDDYTDDMLSQIGPSRHYTMVFNTFVILQIFNFFNARKLQDEKNIFEDLSKSSMFNVVVIIISVMQLIIGNLGGRPFRVSFNAMDVRQWLIAIAFGFGSWITALLAKFIPSGHFSEIGKEKTDPKIPSKILSLKRSSEEHFQKKLTNAPGMKNNSKQHSITKVTHYHG